MQKFKLLVVGSSLPLLFAFFFIIPATRSSFLISPLLTVLLSHQEETSNDSNQMQTNF